MRILAINVSDKGSTGYLAISVLKYFEKKGHEVVLAVPNPSNQSVRTFNISSSFLNRQFNRLMTKVLGNDGFLNKSNTKRLIRFINSYKPDIVHLHVLHGYFINIKLLLSFLKNTDIRVFWTFHDCWPFTGKCPHFLINNCYKWEHICSHCISKHQYPKSYFFDFSKKMFLAKKNLFQNFNNLTIITVSEWLKLMTSKSICSNLPLRVIRNGVDFSHIAISVDDSSKKTTNVIKILAVANPWSQRKGIDFLNSFAEYCDKKNSPIRITCVGLTNKNNTYKTIERHGVVSREDLSLFYKSTDVFVSFSREETFGMTIVEALFFGKPVVVMNNSGGSNEIASSDCGRSIDFGDCFSLEKSILELNALTHNNSFSELCINRAKQFSLEKMNAEYYTLMTKENEN